MAEPAQPTGAKSLPQRPRSAPLSPHLQIWRFTVTMAASITQRGTGVANFVGVIVLAAWLFAAASGPETFAPVGGFLASPIGLIAITGFIWSLSFHMMNGLRYLYWDSGRGFRPETARATGWAVYAGSVILTALILVLGITARGGA